MRIYAAAHPQPRLSRSGSRRRSPRCAVHWRPRPAGAHAGRVEIGSAEAAPAKLSLFRGRARLVVSYHNYEATPQLDTLLNRLTRIPADGYKIVTTARKPSDYGRVLALAKAHPRTPLI